MTRLAYYPGCTLKTNAKNFEDSTIATAEKLDIELVEPERCILQPLGEQLEIC